MFLLSGLGSSWFDDKSVTWHPVLDFGGNPVNQAGTTAPNNPQSYSEQDKINGMLDAKAMPFVASIWLLGWGIIILGVPSVVPWIHRTFRRLDPSPTDLKIAKIVGYMGIIFGSVALIQGLVGLAH